MPGGGTSIKHRSTDPYRVLGLEPGCSEVEAKRAYLQLAKQFHPDVCQAPDAADRFRNVTDAYDAVSLRLKSSSVGRPGGGGHGGYDAERMAARVREFRQRAEEMRASHKTRARAGARADAWLELQRRIGDRKFMLAIPIMLLVGWAFVRTTEHEMQRRRAIASTDEVVFRSRSQAARPRADDKQRPKAVDAPTRTEFARDESGRLPRAERDRQALLRRHLLAMAAEQRLPTVARAGSVAEEQASHPPQQAPLSGCSSPALAPGPLDEVVMDRRRSGDSSASHRFGQRRVLAPSAVAGVEIGSFDRV